MKCSQCFALSKGVKEIRSTTITTIYRFINQKNDGGKAGCSYFFLHQRLNKQVQVRRHFKVLIEYKLMIIQHKITIAKVEKDEFRRGRKNCVQAANSNFLLALLALTLEEHCAIVVVPRMMLAQCFPCILGFVAVVVSFDLFCCTSITFATEIPCRFLNL